MNSLGTTLQAERVRQGLSLEAVSARTKVPVRQLLLLEAQQYEKLPGAFLARNFARQYAECLGLSRQEIEPELHELTALFQPPAAMRAARPEFGGKIDLLRIARDQPRLHPLLWLLVAVLAMVLVYKIYQRSAHGAARRPGASVGSAMASGRRV
ncbi:MAG TPA: hypothetical protein DEQ47_19705 [Solibacterales bacterium]|nr:hypothetical protein [Bryobacterales bacterium]